MTLSSPRTRELKAELAPVERPILMSAPMVRTCLREVDPKEQTRRVVKAPWPTDAEPEEMSKVSAEGWQVSGHSGLWWDATSGDDSAAVRCPYGKPGDRLWVRETWKPHSFYTDMKPRDMPVSKVFYAADDAYAPSNTRWHPSIFMPRWASRITLQITDVRVERLNDISEADAKAEGVEPPETEREDHDWSICPACGGTGLHGALGDRLGYMEVDCSTCDTHAKRFRHLWERINGEGSWDANPFCWVVAFRQVIP